MGLLDDLGLNAATAGVNSLLSLGTSTIDYNRQKNLMAQQYKYQKDFYDYTYDMESPANQVRRLKEAGLNPALAYGQVQDAGGSAGAMPSASSSKTQSGQVDFLAAKQMDMMQKLNDSEVSKNEAEAEDAKARALEPFMQYLSPEDRNRFAKATLSGQEYQADKLKSEVDLNNQKRDEILQNIKESNARIKNLDQETALAYEQTLNAIQRGNNMTVEYDLLVAQVGKEKAQKAMFYASASMLQAQAELYDEEFTQKKAYRKNGFMYADMKNFSHKLFVEASNAETMTHEQIEKLRAEIQHAKAAAYEAGATSGSALWDIILDIVSLITSKPRKVGYK